MMRIGDVAKQSGLPVKTIRYYEEIGLIAPEGRGANGYRLFSDQDMHRLAFIRRGRSLGFSIDQMKDLLALWQDKQRASADVRALATDHIGMLDDKIRELTEMRQTLSALVSACNGDDRPDCPIIDSLSTSEPS